MRYLLVLSLLAASCGGSFLEPGDYTVSEFFVDDNYRGRVGEEIVTIWTFEEDGDKYKVTVMGEVKNAKGTVEGNSIKIYKKTTNMCGMDIVFSAEITPHDELNTRFTGTSILEINTCDNDYLRTEAHLIGETQ
jgi:hypothetical protein